MGAVAEAVPGLVEGPDPDPGRDRTGRVWTGSRWRQSRATSPGSDGMRSGIMLGYWSSAAVVVASAIDSQRGEGCIGTSGIYLFICVCREKGGGERSYLG